MEPEGSSLPAAPPAWMRLSVGRNPAWTLVRILFLVFAALILFKFILIPIRVTGDSMLPTCHNGQIKFVNKLAYWHHAPHRGDIVAAEFEGRRILLLKRIIGMPGELFQVRNGDIFINGKKLDEPYTKGRIPAPDNKGFGSTPPIQLGPTEYMVIGDNRTISEGYQKDESAIVGKIL